MGKVSDNMTALSTLLNETNNKAEVDNAPEEFKKKAGRPKKVVIYCFE